MSNRTAAEWHAYIRAAVSFAAAQDRMEEALSAGVDFATMLCAQDADDGADS